MSAKAGRHKVKVNPKGGREMGFPRNDRSSAHPKRTNGSADLLAWLVGIKLAFFDRSNSTYAVHHPPLPLLYFSSISLAFAVPRPAHAYTHAHVHGRFHPHSRASTAAISTAEQGTEIAHKTKINAEKRVIEREKERKTKFAKSRPTRDQDKLRSRGRPTVLDDRGI